MNNQQDNSLTNTDFGTWSNTPQNSIDRRGFLKLVIGGAAATLLAAMNPTSSAQEIERETLVQNNSIQVNLFDATLEDIYSPEVRTILNQIQYSVITNDYSNFDTLETRLNAIDVLSAFYVNTFNITDLEEISYYRGMRNRVSFFGEEETPCGDNAASCASFDRMSGTIPLPEYENWFMIYTHELSHQIPQSYSLENVQVENRAYLINSNFAKQIDDNLHTSTIVSVAPDSVTMIKTDAIRLSFSIEVNADILSDIVLQRLTTQSLNKFGPYVDGVSTAPNSQRTPTYYKNVIRHISSNENGSGSTRQCMYQFVKSHNLIAIGQTIARVAIERLGVDSDTFLQERSILRRSLNESGYPILNRENEQSFAGRLLDYIKHGIYIMGDLCENASILHAVANTYTPDRRDPKVILLGNINEIIEKLNNNIDISEHISIQWD